MTESFGTWKGNTTMNGQILRDKLIKLEDFHTSPSNFGNRGNREVPVETIRARHEELKRQEGILEHQVNIQDPWSHSLFTALCRRYGMEPFRYPRQRRTTAMIRVPASFLNQIILPEFDELNRTLHDLLRQSTEAIIKEAVHSDFSMDNVAINAPRVSLRTAQKGLKTKNRTLVVHCKKSKYDVYIGRPSKWGNPFKIGSAGTRQVVIQKYRKWLVEKRPDLVNAAKRELKGKVLGCWCAPNPCVTETFWQRSRMGSKIYVAFSKDFSPKSLFY
jgi:hypothetical protein